MIDYETFSKIHDCHDRQGLTIAQTAAAYIADALMELALQFEATHFAQIRRHYQSITPKRDDVPWQLNMFGKHPLS